MGQGGKQKKNSSAFGSGGQNSAMVKFFIYRYVSGLLFPFINGAIALLYIP